MYIYLYIYICGLCSLGYEVIHVNKNKNVFKKTWGFCFRSSGEFSFRTWPGR